MPLTFSYIQKQPILYKDLNKERVTTKSAVDYWTRLLFGQAFVLIFRKKPTFYN